MKNRPPVLGLRLSSLNAESNTGLAAMEDISILVYIQVYNNTYC